MTTEHDLPPLPPADSERAAFEAWFSNQGAWPKAVARSGDGYILQAAHSAWEVWQAARRSMMKGEPAHPTIPEGAGWQPIETAPTETHVLVFIPRTLSTGVESNYQEVAVLWNDEWSNLAGDPISEYRAFPTHWMPLPPPPVNPNSVKDAHAAQVVYRWQAMDYSGFCYGSNPPQNLPEHCKPIAFCRQPGAFLEALVEIAETTNRTATHQQFARHLQKIAQDAINGETEAQ